MAKLMADQFLVLLTYSSSVNYSLFLKKFNIFIKHIVNLWHSSIIIIGLTDPVIPLVIFALANSNHTDEFIKSNIC